MGLIKKTSDKAAVTAKNQPAADGTLKGNAKFEDEPTTTTAAPKTEVQQETIQPNASTAVAVKQQGAVAVQGGGIKMMNVIAEHKDKLTVNWNTLDRIQANNGNFLDVGNSKASMGAEIQVQLLSWQDSYQVSPGSDDEEAKQHVRYSDDGIVTTKGENIAEYLQKLHGVGYTKAACDHRVTIAGVLVGSEKDCRLEGELIQIDLSKTSREEYDKYKIGTAFKIGKEMLTADEALTMTMKAEVANWKGKSWTVVKFSPTKLQAA